MPLHSQEPVRRRRLVLAVLSGAAFMASLDLFIVNVALNDIGRDFASPGLDDLSWILNAYAIVYAALLIPLGRLADRFGRKAGFLLGLGVFTAASAACAASADTWMLVGFRILQAAGAAALTPTSLGLLLAATPAAHRLGAVRIWAASGALAAAAGPVIGGLLVDASWRWAFVINIPIGVGLIVAAWRVVPDSRDTSVSRLPDLIGAAILTVAIAALALGLVKGPTWDWGSGRVLASFLAAAIGIALFWRRTQAHPAPVVEPALLRVPTFAWSNVTTVLFSVAFAGVLLSNVLWLQDVWGYSALRTGLAIAPGPLMVPLFAAVGQRLSGTVPAGRLVAAGCLLLAAGGALAILLVDSDPNYAGALLPGWLVGGVGVGLALPTLLSAATVDLPPARTSTGSAVVTMSRQLGTVIGVSVVVAVLGTPTPAGALDAFQRTWTVIAVTAAVAGLVALRMSPRRPGMTARADQPALAGEAGEAGNVGKGGQEG